MTKCVNQPLFCTDWIWKWVRLPIGHWSIKNPRCTDEQSNVIKHMLSGYKKREENKEYGKKLENHITFKYIYTGWGK